MEGTTSLGGQLDAGADAARQAHLGQGHQEAAVRQVVAGLDAAADDLAAHEVAVAALDGEIDRRRGAFLAAVQASRR